MNKQEKQKFIAECKSWLNPPTGWMHGVCVKGFRVDCAMFLLAIAKTMGWVPSDYAVEPYPRDWALHRSESKMMKEIEKFCNPVSDKTIKIGDILVYKFGRTNSHCAFYIGDDTAIHSHIQYGVVEFKTDNFEMKNRLKNIMRFRER